METVKTDNDRTMETSPHEAGFFYRRIGGTLFKVCFCPCTLLNTPDCKGAGFTVEHIPVRFCYEVLFPECLELSVFGHLRSVLFKILKKCSSFFKNTSVFVAVFLLLVKVVILFARKAITRKEAVYGGRVKSKSGYRIRKHRKHYNGNEPETQGRMNGNGKNR